MTDSPLGPRVALIAPVYPLRGGIAHHTACLTRALLARGADARVISYRRLYPRALFAGTSELDDTSRRPIDVAGAEAVLVPWDPRTWPRALARIEAQDPALVVLAWWHSFQLPLAVALLSALRARGRRTLFLCHNVASHEVGALDAAAWSLLPHLPHAFLVHGSHQADVLRRRLARVGPQHRPVLVSPHPSYDVFAEISHAKDASATAARERLGLRHDDEVVLLFGLVRRYKGLDLALHAMAELAHRRPRAVLVVAGEHYDEPRSPVPAGAHIVMHDRFIANEDVADYFRAADVVLAPYRPGQSHSGVVQIARAFGVPVVGTNIDGLRELVEHERTGLIVEPAALPEALDRILADKDLRARLAQTMLASAARYTWATLADVVLGAARPRGA